MARPGAKALQDLAAAVRFGAALAAQYATAHAAQTTAAPTAAQLLAQQPAAVRAAIRAWAQALAPANADFTALWTRSAVLSGQQGMADNAPAIPFAELGRIYERLLALTPTWQPATATVELQTAAGHARRKSGSYYTPPALVAGVVDAVIGPLIRDALQAADPACALLTVRVLDPACGSGHFLLAVADRIANALSGARGHATAGARERSEVIRHCVFGVDLDPTAVDLCRASLWQWCGFDADSASAIASHVRWGNALLGLGPRDGLERTPDGIPDSAYKASATDDRGCLRNLRRANSAARRDPQLLRALDAMHDPHHAEAVWLANAWCAAFVLPKIGGATVPTNADLACAVRGIPLAPNLSEAVSQAALGHRFFHWRHGYPEVFASAASGFDAVVGNPPYLNQLQSDTAVQRPTAELLRHCTGGIATGYADTAAAFWARVPDWLRPGGRAGLVVPHSLLVTADTAALRERLLTVGHLQGLWVAGERAFADADVMTCAPIWQSKPVGDPGSAEDSTPAIARWTGAACVPTAPASVDNAALAKAATWGIVAADLLGIPIVPCQPQWRLADWASATADFRDQYYGLDGFVVDRADGDPWQWAPLITAGLLDLAACHHGVRPTRLLKRDWQAPRVDVVRMRSDGTLGPWMALRQVPKVLVATQTPVLEVWVDAVGAALPSVPVLTVVPRDPAALWTVGAALASPVAAAWAAGQFAGAALALTALKLSASQLLALPAPDATAAQWPLAVRAFQAAHTAPTQNQRAAQLRVFGDAAVRCHGLDHGSAQRVLAWWLRRAGLA